MAKIGCVSTLLGIVSMLLAVITRLSSWSPMHLGPRSFAAGSALLLLLSIALHTCQSVCCSEEPAPKG
jgi:hypothetical protein